VEGLNRKFGLDESKEFQETAQSDPREGKRRQNFA
jgi:hypothetical protein